MTKLEYSIRHNAAQPGFADPVSTRNWCSSLPTFIGWRIGAYPSERYNLAQQPMAFATNAVVNGALKQSGNDCLPLILLNGTIVSQGQYPNRDELARLIRSRPSSVQQPAGMKLPVIQSGCCGGNSDG